MQQEIWYSEHFYISTRKEDLQIDVIHEFLSQEAYWCKNIALETVQRSIENSLTFGVYEIATDKQVGYAKIITDFATIAYLGDVFIVESHRGKGLSKWLLEIIMEYVPLQGLRRWILGTRDAHELYQKYGWQPIASPERWMEIYNPAVYA
jgi:GNAT superfamily N-acetyltransferase